jgi:hypothetical protein
MSDLLLTRWEDNIPYRTVSPRHFEAAAFRVVQILFEGRYSGVLQPDLHYLSLRKDFSNLDDVLRQLADVDIRRTITERAYADIIQSGRYSYRTFVSEFDDDLARRGIELAFDEAAVTRTRRALARGAFGRRILREVRLRRRDLGRRRAGRLVRWATRKAGH